MRDMANANQSSRFEVVGDLLIHGHEGVLLWEAYSRVWTATINIRGGLGDDGVPVTAHGKDREEVIARLTDSVRKTIGWLGAKAA